MKTTFFLVVLVGVMGAMAWRASVAVAPSYTLIRAAKMGAGAGEAWSAISSLDKQKEWRRNLVETEELPKLRGHTAWREVLSDGSSFSLETVEILDERRLVRCVIDQGGPIGGCWTIEVVPRDEKCAVQITEKVVVHSPWFRLTNSKNSRQEFLDTYLRDLAHKFGDDTPRLGKDFPEVSREPEPEPPPSPEGDQ